MFETRKIIFAVLVLLTVSQVASAQRAKYTIVSLGQPGEMVSGGQAVSPNGQYGAGFTDQVATLWNAKGGILNLAPVPSRPFSVPEGVNDFGTVAGIGATTFFGSSPLPVIWKNDMAIILELPAGQTLGRAYGLNNAEVVVGSVNGGSVEVAAMFSEKSAGSVITETLPNGGILRVAYGISNTGRIVGSGTNPNNAAVTSGWYLDPGDATATNIGALVEIGHNSAVPFGVSSAGLITGSSSLNSGVNGRAFLWTDDDGMKELPLPPGATSASGRGVNDDGWVVGNAGGVTSLPFIYDGSGTYLLQDVIAFDGDGWDLTAGTSNAAFCISNDGTIFGRGLLNGQLTGFAMIRTILIGDTNGDGEVSLLDVSPFVITVAGGPFLEAADINCDGEINLLDVGPFVDLLTGN